MGKKEVAMAGLKVIGDIAQKAITPIAGEGAKKLFATPNEDTSNTMSKNDYNSKVRKNRDYGEAYTVLSRDPGFVKPKDNTYNRLNRLETKAKTEASMETAGEALVKMVGSLFSLFGR